jgi:peptidyl-prolyl cis-trans isomerase SurA
MNRIFFTVILAFFATGSALTAQPTDPVLFSIDGIPVHVSEFRYGYAKNNQDKADFSKASLLEYLDLYIKFKLKVHKARAMRVDTISTLSEELDGYRRQLANNYLSDREVTDQLVRELHNHMQRDIDISYIFLGCERSASAKDTLKAYNRCLNWLNMIKKGTPFEKLAVDSSQDNSVKENKGHLGYITAILPDGYYDFERAIYNAKPGDVIGPVRSNTGYQIVRINASRPARGEVEVGQIMVRKSAAAKIRIDSIYKALQGGANWEALCNAVSEDKMTAYNGGYIGFFGISRYERSFEDAAFGIEKDGGFSAPVETSIGWHIVRRLSSRGIPTFEASKRMLAERVKRDSRIETARQSMIARIKRDAKYVEYGDVLSTWAAKQHDTIFHTFRFKPDPAKPNQPLIRFGSDKVYTLADFENYCAQASRERMRGSGFPIEETISRLFSLWSADCAIRYEESQLEKKYPDFKALMREYEEGMLLFEVAKQEVWDRANTDTLGLEKYYKESLTEKYKWDERAQVSIYVLKTDDAAIAKKVRAFAAKNPSAAVLKKFNKKTPLLTVTERNFEKGKNKDYDNLWTVGAMSEPKVDAGTKTTTFSKVEAITPPTSKNLSDARGYAVADYQDYLEKQWVERLRKAYKVIVNEEVLQSLVK